MTRACAILLAGGRGHRAGRAKQFAKVGGRSLLMHAVDPFLRCSEVASIVLVVPAAQVARVERDVHAQQFKLPVQVVAGGDTRHRSSRAGVKAAPADCNVLLIHDAARVFASRGLIQRVIAAATRSGGAVPALEVADSVVEVTPRGGLKEYLPRRRLRAIQTPQGFRRNVLEKAFATVRAADFTDDGSVVRKAGGRVVVIEGEESNRKITTANDLKRALDALKG